MGHLIYLPGTLQQVFQLICLQQDFSYSEKVTLIFSTRTFSKESIKECATQSNDWRLYLARKTTGFQGIRLLLAKDNNINKFYKIIIIKIHIYIKIIIIITFYGDLSSINSFSDLPGFLIVLFKHSSESI